MSSLKNAGSNPIKNIILKYKNKLLELSIKVSISFENYDTTLFQIFLI